MKRSEPNILQKYYSDNPSVYEIGVDEAGRGPLFGRVYTAAVILPKDDTFDHSLMKDSKKFHSKTQIQKVAKYIQEHALTWAVTFEDEKKIDQVNILQATQESMRNSITQVRNQWNQKMSEQEKKENQDFSFQLLIDGNYFTPMTQISKTTGRFYTLNHVTIEGGDNKYSCIAAASILAKVGRDTYIEELCEEYPWLQERYNIASNKGYGAKVHLDGIHEYGITEWHRKSFGICKRIHMKNKLLGKYTLYTAEDFVNL